MKKILMSLICLSFSSSMYANKCVDEIASRVTVEQGFFIDINLISCHLQDGDIANIVNFLKTLQPNSLEWLQLNNNDIGDQGASELGNFLSGDGASLLSKFVMLDLQDNHIGDVGAVSVSKISELEELNLSNNQIGDAGVEAIALNPTLIDLKLDGNHIGASGAAALGQAKSVNLFEISLNSNHIGDVGAMLLAENLLIDYLSLLDNGITDDGAKSLAKLPYVSQLNLCKNQIGDSGAMVLSRQNYYWLDVSYNKIGSTGIKALRSSANIKNLISNGNPGS